MGGQPLAAHPHLLDRRGDLGVGHLRRLRAHAGDVLAGEIELDRVDAVLHEGAHAAAHLVGAAHDGAEAEFRIWQVRRRLVAQAARHRDLLARGQVARTRDQAGVDGIAGGDVEARLGAGGADAGREAAAQVALGDMRAPEDVLLQRHLLDRAQAGLVVPGKMGVRLGHARHQGRAGGIDGVDAGGRQRAGDRGRPSGSGCPAPVLRRRYGCAPVPSRMRTLVKRTLPIASPVPLLAAARRPDRVVSSSVLGPRPKMRLESQIG